MKGIGRRRLLAGGGAAVVGLSTPALAASERDRVLRFMPQVDLVTLDPHYSMTNVTRNHAGLVFDQLYGTDSHQQAQPQMAAGHVMEDGGRRWTLTLRDGLLFHDGQKVLARDCVASIRRWGRRDVLGVELLRISDEITATGETTLVFRFKTPFPRLPQALGKPGNEVLADLLKRIGINLDYISMDWSSMTQRVINKGPPEVSGFHIHALNVPSLSVGSPLVNSRLRGTASEESGWYSSARYEALRAEWLVATDPADQARLDGELQRECLATVPLVPAGVTLQPAAWRADLEGVLSGVPKFWNVRRRA